LIPLPIDPVLPEIVEGLRRAGRLVLEAPPGAGKTTRVPPAILGAGLAGDGEIVVLQPRRLAARLAARRVAEERGEKLGDTIGFQIRFEDVSSPRTRIRYVTEGILSRRLLSDPTLSKVSVVVLDEFHERHLAGDVALATLRRLQGGPRPDLRLVVMSATLDADPVVHFLGDCPRVRSEGRVFPVAIDHIDLPDERPLEQQVAKAIRRLVSEGLDGDVLVFLPGAAEIRRAREACEEVAARHGLLLLALHGDLAPEEQDRAVRPGDRPKLILSTNVAETSVTIPGVAAVVDSGLARIASHSPWSGLPTLKVAKVSRASAAQRAGRAGRTREGRCLRLYTKHDHAARPAFDTPEVRRLDLAETVLELHMTGGSNGEADVARFEWFEAPDPAAIRAADDLLERLGAVKDGAVTDVGRRMLHFPVHPRIGRLLVEAERRGVGKDAARVAAVLGERDRGAANRQGTGPSDVLAAAEEPGRHIDRATRQIERLVRDSAQVPKNVDDALLACILTAYPDRVARRRRRGHPEVLLAGGGAATLARESVVREAELMVAVDAEARHPSVLVRSASAVQADWLLDLYPDRVRTETVVTWNDEAERVEATERLVYDALVLDESRAKGASEEASRLLAEHAVAAGLAALAEPGAWDRWIARLDLVARTLPELGIAIPTNDDLGRMLRVMCAGRRSFEELREAGLLHAVEAPLSPDQRQALAREAPDRIPLHAGRAARVEYAFGRPPWVESRLQDFFGVAVGPSLCRGRVPVVLHLLAPNGRAVQVTTDLAGFWDRHYPAVRKELMRKYPGHSWPENPRTASPPQRRRRQ